MTKKQITPLVMVNLLEMMGEQSDRWNVRTRYSGRGMRGDSCVGVVLKQRDTLALGAMLARAAVEDLATDVTEAIEVAEEVERLMTRACEDSMGLDTIVYWPELSVGDAGPDEDADFEEESGR